MSELTVQIEQLEPLRVAATAVTSESPEDDAISALLDWARSQGLLDGHFRFFGYDNCQPHPNHTYTTWISVGKDVKPSGKVEIMDFPGGRYAVIDIRGVEQISSQWEQLAQWSRQQGYTPGDQPCLEEHLDVLADLPLSDRRFRLHQSVR